MYNSGMRSNRKSLFFENLTKLFVTQIKALRTRIFGCPIHCTHRRAAIIGMHILQRTAVAGTSFKVLRRRRTNQVAAAAVDRVPNSRIERRRRLRSADAILVRRLLSSQLGRTFGRLVDAQRGGSLFQPKGFECPADSEQRKAKEYVRQNPRR